MKKALVIGCSGQDGGYLVRDLEERDYLVAGIDRGAVSGPLEADRAVDIRNKEEVLELMKRFAPEEVYYLAAFHQSSEGVVVAVNDLVQQSFEINTIGLNNFLAAIAEIMRHARLFYAASSRIFGEASTECQDENTPLEPIDPYGISKAAGVHLCRYYRREHKVYASVGVLYNHESPRRDPAYISRKIVQAAVRIARRAQDKLVVSDLDAMVDWGYAPDYVDAMWRILQLPESDDFVIATGALHSVREMVEIAFNAAGLNWTEHVEVKPQHTRNQGRRALRGNSARLEARTGWRPTISLPEMIRDMVRAEMQNEL